MRRALFIVIVATLLACSSSPADSSGGGGAVVSTMTGNDDSVTGSANVSGTLGDGPFVPKSALFVNFSDANEQDTRLILSTYEDYCSFSDHVASVKYPDPKNSQAAWALFDSIITGPVTEPIQHGVDVQSYRTGATCLSYNTVVLNVGNVTITDVGGDTLTGTIDVTSNEGTALHGSFTAALCNALLTDPAGHPPVCN